MCWTRALTLSLLASCVLASVADAQRARPRSSRATRRTAVITGPSARFRCWSERPEDCAAAVSRLQKAGSRRVVRKPDSGWTQDVELTFARASSIPQAAEAAKGMVDDLRQHRFSARLSLQDGTHEWLYSTDDSEAHVRARLAQGTLRKIKERRSTGDLEIGLAGAGGKVLKGTDQQVDGVLRNRAAHPVTVQLAHGCDLEVSATTRGNDRIVALSPCADAGETLRLAPGESFLFRGASVPSDVTGSYFVYATLVGKLDGQSVEMRTKPMRIDFRKAERKDVSGWAAARKGCTPATLPPPGTGEVAGSYMLALVPGVDADAFADYLASKRRLNVTVSTHRYLRLRGTDADAAPLGCLAGVERVIRDVEEKH